MKARGAFILVLLFALFSNCSVIIGIKKIKPLSEKDIISQSIKYGIKENEIYMLDTSAFFNDFKKLKNTHPKLLNDLSQPLQIRAYNQNDSLSLFLINCNIGGFPTLQWNIAGSLDYFPPQQNIIIKPDTSFILQQEKKYWRLIHAASGIIPDEKIDLTFVVYWASFMNKHSKNLIQVAYSYKKKFSHQNIKIVFINMDNLFID